MNIDGIIFDLDGTLWDSCASVAASWQLTLRRYYGPRAALTEADIRSIMGMTPDEIATALFSGYGDAAGEVCRRCLAEECPYIAEHGGLIYPGTGEMLASLSRSRRLFIVSNCAVGYIECFLDYSGLSRFFSGSVCQGATGMGKADNIRLLIRRERLQNPVYVGDTDSDRRSAAEAGCAFVHAAYGFGGAVRAEHVIDSPLELVGLVEDWSKANV